MMPTRYQHRLDGLTLSPLLASLPDDPPPRSNDGEGDDSVKPEPLNVLFATTVPRLLVELRYHELAGAMRDKVDWERKVLDASVADKWRDEAIAQGASAAAAAREGLAVLAAVKRGSRAAG